MLSYGKLQGKSFLNANCQKCVNERINSYEDHPRTLSTFLMFKEYFKIYGQNLLKNIKNIASAKLCMWWTHNGHLHKI